MHPNPGVVSGEPERMDAYSRSATLRHRDLEAAIDRLASALAAVDAADSDRGLRLGGLTGTWYEHLAELRRLDAMPSQYAEAFRLADGGLTGPGRVLWLDALEATVAEALAHARADLGSSAPLAQVNARAAATLGGAQARRLADATARPGSGELQTVLGEAEALRRRYPQLAAAYADALVNELGAPGVHTTVEALRRTQAQQCARDVGRELLTPFAGLLADASRPEGVGQPVLDGIAAGDVTNLGLLLAAGAGAHERFVGPAFDRVMGGERASFAGTDDTLARAVMHGDARVGALRALSRDPSLAFKKVAERSPQGAALRDQLLFGAFGDDGDAAGAVLVAGLRDHPLRQPAARGDAEAAFAEIILRVGDPPPLPAPMTVDLPPMPLDAVPNDGARVGLAELSAAWMDELAGVAADRPGSGPIGSLAGREKLAPFITDLKRSPAADAALARGYGAYMAAQLHAGAAEVAASGSLVDMNTQVDRVAKLGGVLIGAEKAALEQDARAVRFLIGAGEAAVVTAASGGLAASALTAGTSAATAVAAQYAAQAAAAIPLPAFDKAATLRDLEHTLDVLAAQALAAHDPNAARYGLSPEEIGLLRDGYVVARAVANFDGDDVDQVRDVLFKHANFNDEVIGLREHALNTVGRQLN